MPTWFNVRHPALPPLLGTPGRQVAAGIVLIGAVVIGSFAYDQWQHYDDALARADRDTRNAAVLLAENTARTFDAIDGTLRAVAALHHDIAAGLYRDRATIHNLLQAIHGGSPVLRAIGLIDADGNRVYSSLDIDPPPLNVAEQEHFTAQRDGNGSAIHVAAPIRSKLTGDWIINVSLRLESPDGRFAGIAAGVVDPNYFSAVYRSIELGPSRIAALFRGDGIILAREPALEGRLGKSVAEAGWFRDLLPRVAVGTAHGRSRFDGSEQIGSYARVPGGGQVVGVSILRAEALADFREELIHGGARIGVGLFVLIVGARFLIIQLRRRQRADGRFRDLLEAAPDAMVIVDRQGRIALVNAQVEKLFGYGRGELLGKPVEMLMSEQYRAGHPALRDGFMAGPRKRPMGSGLDLHGRRKDGTEFPLEIGLSPLDTDDGVLVSATIRDISERKQAEAELIESRKAAEAASRAKSDFLSGMSHELRTPLNALIGFGQMLEMNRERTLTDSQREYVGYIISSGHHLLDLVNDVLDLAGIESGRLKLSIERVLIGDIFEQVRRTMSPLAQTAGISFQTILTDGPVAVRADHLRLRQVLINLVSNAIKYNRSGGAVTLTALSAAGGRVRCLVADTGIGIAPEHHKDLFQPFQRLGAKDIGVEGTGIGLALSRKLIKAMNGTIGFASEPGLGSTFWVDLPADATGAAVAGTDGQALPLALPRASAGGYSLLYVEDNPASLRLMEHLLSTLPGVEMLSAPTPQLGLDLAIAHRPDVIVLDLNLPGMSGFDVLARLKALPATRDIPVLALTAAAFPGDTRKGMAAGFFRYITKPLDVNAFLVAVDEALMKASAQPRPARAEPEPQRPLDILIADDHEISRTLTSALVSQLGHRVERVGNGREAVAAVQSHRYDLVLMDMEMPDMNGVAATKAIRALTTPANLTPVIALTAHAFPGLREELVSAGMNDYLTKPIQREALAEVLARWATRAGRSAA